MKPRVYVETSVIGYLTSWLSRDVVVLGRQQVTRDWWATAADRYELVVSDFVIQEASLGDTIAAQDQLEILKDLPRLAVTDQSAELTDRLIVPGPLPIKAKLDAAHIALAAVYRIPYLVTWNFKHIANISMRTDIERICRESGNQPALLCSPDELMGDQYEAPTF